jgi:hypothetical protein
MTYEKEPVILKWNTVYQNTYPDELSFENLLDTMCGRLREKHAEYSIRRIGEMNEELVKLEKNLDEFMKTQEPKNHRPKFRIKIPRSWHR